MPKFPPTTIAVEEVIETTELVPRHILAQGVKTAASLKPGVAMIEAAALGQPEACAIREAWKFNQPVKVISREDYAALVDRCGGVVFIG